MGECELVIRVNRLAAAVEGNVPERNVVGNPATDGRPDLARRRNVVRESTTGIVCGKFPSPLVEDCRVEGE